MTLNRKACIVAGLTAGVLGATGMVGVGAAHADTVGPATGNSTTAVVNTKSITAERSVSGAAITGTSVVQGETVTITNKLTRAAGTAWLVYNVQDNHDACLKRVPGTSVWTVSGTTYTEAQKPSEVTAGAGWVKIDAPAANSWSPTPLVWKQDYVVDCAPGPLNTGGVQWSSTNATERGNDIRNLGPSITVTATPTKTATATLVSVSPAPKVGEPSTVSAKVTSDSAVTDGIVEFFNNNVSIGTANVVNGTASVSWKPTGEGGYVLKAVYSGTGTLAGSTSTNSGTVAPKDPDPEPGAPSIVLSAAPKVGDPVTITVSSDAVSGSAVTLTANGSAICADTKLGTDGKATCTWTPSGAGAVAIKAVIGAQSTIKNVTVAAADNGGGDNGGGNNGGGDNGGGNNGGGDNGGGNNGGGGSSSGSLGDIFGS